MLMVLFPKLKSFRIRSSDYISTSKQNTGGRLNLEQSTSFESSGLVSTLPYGYNKAVMQPKLYTLEH